MTPATGPTVTADAAPSIPVLSDAEVAKLDADLALIRAYGAMNRLRAEVARNVAVAIERDPLVDAKALAIAWRALKLSNRNLKSQLTFARAVVFESEGWIVRQAINSVAAELRRTPQTPSAYPPMP